MSDLKNIQKIYEGYNGYGQDVPLNNYMPSTSSRTSSTYQKPLPTTTPDKPAYVQANMGTAPIESEEDVTGNISRAAVVKLLSKEMENAAAKDMDYCVFVLGKLIQAVKGN
jgi:hypothetical protein